jgi:hypothetical protein
MKTITRLVVCFGVLIVLTALVAFTRSYSRNVGQHEHFDLIHHLSSGPATDVWEIKNPEVRKPRTSYKGIQFRPGDKITIEAGGCVQTGGKGKTWKLYVSPSADDRSLYHGLVGIPRPDVANFTESARVPGLVKIEDVTGKSWNIVDSKDEHEGDFGFSYLVLGYEDNNYTDNGYRDPDDGTDDQCKGVSNAWVKVSIEHASQR